jgi:hypothetical protein
LICNCQERVDTVVERVEQSLEVVRGMLWLWVEVAMLQFVTSLYFEVSASAFEGDEYLDTSANGRKSLGV